MRESVNVNRRNGQTRLKRRTNEEVTKEGSTVKVKIYLTKDKIEKNEEEERKSRKTFTPLRTSSLHFKDSIKYSLCEGT